MTLFKLFHNWLEKITRSKESELKVEAIKQDTADQAQKATKSIEKVGQLQSLVLKRTTTYYIGKAMGVVS